MIHRDSFYIGQRVRFQDATFTWRQGQVVEIKWRHLTLAGPGGSLTETQPTRIIVAFRDAVKRGWTERELPVKRVRPLEEETGNGRPMPHVR